MKVTPSSTARRSTAIATARSGGAPQMPVPVTRMAPNPRRLTVRSPPTSMVPATAALVSGMPKGYPARPEGRSSRADQLLAEPGRQPADELAAAHRVHDEDR